MQTYICTSLKAGSIALDVQQFVQGMCSRGLPGTSVEHLKVPRLASRWLELQGGTGVQEKATEHTSLTAA